MMQKLGICMDWLYVDVDVEVDVEVGDQTNLWLHLRAHRSLSRPYTLGR